VALTRDQLEATAAPLGLTMPVDPSSSGFATLGGLCATNAAGARTVRYGPMRAWVHGLDCVFADGSRAWVHRGGALPAVPALERFLRDVAPAVERAPVQALRHAGVRKESSGYGLSAWRESRDVLDVLIGSEGTLCCIVGVELRLMPVHQATAGLLAGFPDLEGAAAGRLAENGATAVELLDRSFLEIASAEGEPLPLPPGLEAVLIVEADGDNDAGARESARQLAGWCEAGGASHVELALSAEDERRLWAIRHAASPILNRLAPRLQSMQLVEDGCVPPDRFAEYVRGVRSALRNARFRGVIFGHAGDSHAHVNALVDVLDPDWRARAERLVNEVTGLVARLGGTLAGEHGDGRLRAPLSARVWSAEARELFAATKRAFDPQGLLNPGVKIAAEGAHPLETVKYDTRLPPLPEEARAALDLVTQEKAWHRHRLDLLPAAVP
jgi:FAD/FMN-containing dehydrogenase